MWSDFEGDDGHHIVAADSAAAITIDSSSSDDIQTTVIKIDKIWNRTDAMLNQQTFDVAVDEMYACTVTRIDVGSAVTRYGIKHLCCADTSARVREVCVESIPAACTIRLH